MIEIVTNGKCPRCNQLHMYLKQKGLNPQYKYISEGLDIPKEMGGSLPMVIVGDKWIKYHPMMAKTITDEVIKLKESTKQSYPKKGEELDNSQEKTT